MTNLVPPNEIETIVGAKRLPTVHLGRAVSEDGLFYILHSTQCIEQTQDLRDCEFSLALDNGVDFPVEDELLILSIEGDSLVGHELE